MGNFRSSEQGENFKCSESWLNLFKIMKKRQKPIFSAMYANVQKLTNHGVPEPTLIGGLRAHWIF